MINLRSLIIFKQAWNFQKYVKMFISVNDKKKYNHKWGFETTEI